MRAWSAACAWRLLWAGLLAGAAAGAGAADAMAQLQEFLAQTTSASGDFTQVNPAPRAPAGAAVPAKPQVLHGSFEFLRPGRFRWSVRTPYEQLAVSDGQTLFLYDKDLNQVTRKHLQGSLPASPASILFGSNDLHRDFELQADGSADGIDWIRATPRSHESLFDWVRIGFRGSMPVAMELRDSFGQNTRLDFTHVQRNPPEPAERFRFTPPAGADVLEDR